MPGKFVPARPRDVVKCINPTLRRRGAGAVTKERLRVAFQGEPGAYSEEALLSLLPEAVPHPCRTFREAFRAVDAGAVDAALVPVENSFAGSINETYDLLREHTLEVLAQIVHPINHCLLALPGTRLDDVRRVLSHPQALAQCVEFIEERGLEPVDAYDTAGSARLVRERGRPELAAIASARAASIYGLEVLVGGIQTGRANYTKFFLIASSQRASLVGSRLDPHRARGHLTSLIVTAPNVPGALYRVLGVFARRGINLRKLESRPSRDEPWAYVFFLDLEGEGTEPRIQEALRELQRMRALVKGLGSFPCYETGDLRGSP